MGIRTAPRRNDNDIWTPAELTYGQELKLPGDFKQPGVPTFPATSFGRELKRTMDKLKPPPTARAPSTRKTYVPSELEKNRTSLCTKR